MIFGKTPSSWTLLESTSLGIPPTEKLLILPRDRFCNLLINLSVGRNSFVLFITLCLQLMICMSMLMVVILGICKPVQTCGGRRTTSIIDLIILLCLRQHLLLQMPNQHTEELLGILSSSLQSSKITGIWYCLWLLQRM